MKRGIACAVLAVALVPAGRASSEVPRVHALAGARIVVEPGEVIESGTVVMRDGVIEAVGADTRPPADATTWELEGLTVYAGLIEPYAVRARPETEGSETAQQGGHANPLIRPENDVHSSILARCRGA